MTSDKEIERIMLECKNKGLNSREVLQIMEVPYEWTEDSYLFTFDSMPVEELSEYVDYIFRKRWYTLDKGTPVDGFYSTSKMVSGLRTGRQSSLYFRYKVEIYSSGGKTYLEIIMLYEEFSRTEKIIFTEKYIKKSFNLKLTELDQIADQIKYLKPSIKGYLVCNNCGAYYEVHKEESFENPQNLQFWDPENGVFEGFPDKCECGGSFEYIASPEQPDKKLAERKKTASPTEYMRAPVALILVSLFSFVNYSLYKSIPNTEIIFLAGLFGLVFGFIFALMRYKSQELILSMITRRAYYLFVTALFFVNSGGLIAVLIQFDIYGIKMLEISLFASMGAVYVIGMIFKTISPDNPKNFLDPPL